MKFQDDITMSIASTVKDVLEGKAPKEVKEMDPKKHVSKKGDKFDVVNSKGKVVKSFDNVDAANKYATDNHDDLMKEGPDQPNKPSGKLGQDSGERDFKAKHAIKKIGVKTDLDGTVFTKEETNLSEAYNKSKELSRAKKIDKLVDTISREIRNFPKELTDDSDDQDLAEAFSSLQQGLGDLQYGISDYQYALKNHKESVETKESTNLEEAKIDVDYVGDNALSKKLEKKFKVKIKNTGKTTADVSGTNANLIKFLKSDAYLMDIEDIEDLFPELMESKEAYHDDEDEKKEGNAFTKALNAARKNGDDTFVVSGKKYKVEDYSEDEKEVKETYGKKKKDEEVDEESEKQKKYQAFFNKALKKFGVSSPSELEGDKKKEFFDYVDKNYEADNEEVEESVEEVKEGKIKVTAFTGNDPDTMEGESYKKYGLKLKKVGSSYGYDDVELSGPDSKLIKFAQGNLGVSGKNIKAIQKELDNM